MRPADFDRLYAEHAQGLFGYLAYKTGDRSVAEDLVAETFEAAFKARRRFDRRRASERTWLYTIAINRLRDHARRRGAEQRAMDRVGADPSRFRTFDEEAGFKRLEDSDRLRPALDALSDVERECIALRFGGELTLEEIASALGEPMTTVEGRLYRALRKLRATLEAGEA